MRMDIAYAGTAAEFPEHPLDAIFAETLKRLMKGYEQGWIVVCAGFKVHTKVNPCGGSYIGFTLFRAFAVDKFQAWIE